MASWSSRRLSFWTGSPISSRCRGSTGIACRLETSQEYSRRTTSSGGQSRRWRSATLASGARPRPAGMETTVTAPEASATRIKSPARTTRHGLPGRNSWPGWGRSFRSSAQTAAATRGHRADHLHRPRQPRHTRGRKGRLPIRGYSMRWLPITRSSSQLPSKPNR